MHFPTKALLAILATSVGLATSAAVPPHVELQDRSSKITFTVLNKCKHSFAPIFTPPLPGRSSWPVLAHNEQAVHTFKSDTYRGKVFSPLRKADTTTGDGATWGELALDDGDYNVSLEGGYNVPLLIWNQGRQYQGYCTPAWCDGPSCKDAYKASSGLLEGQGQRSGGETRKPNHSCPPSFGNWIVQFC
ncbi:uncharacterized protein PFL1_06428 [Pseudozyma flocculosa PF-1]|uniref:Uncharacterized protein n=2 Tax=Pseudozyma flocculosa TaxID=84751 RepID=A0A5C3EW09_9BASI|nr:uncharacterized protein PFL1_06428 [Pseudozyma flocculosa PF-1]EPQ25973.1 hypothetical protein PFL1_06428 [Pseudozyma flocculosa PF-1]SPO35726.1 uncharacterized protein PSFLO_01197 [Pseudozyma flocculosa]